MSCSLDSGGSDDAVCGFSVTEAQLNLSALIFISNNGEGVGVNSLSTNTLQLFPSWRRLKWKCTVLSWGEV